MKILRRLLAIGLTCALSASLLCTASAAGTDRNNSVISGGMSHTLAVKADGTVWAWGSNESGQLGQSNSTTGSKTPLKVEGLAAVAVAAGYNFSASLEYDGAVYTWGGGSSEPVKVAGLSGVVAISAGQTDILALKYDGTVWQWTAKPNAVPKQVSGLQNISAVAAGGGHFLALSVSGQVWSWGSNTYGQLGLGDNQDRNTPVQISQLSDIVDIAAGYSHSLAVTFNGAVYSWGANTYGQLGNGTTTASLVPIRIQALSNIKQVAAGTDSSMALTEKGVLYTWGYGEYGQLGTNSTAISQTSPTVIYSSISGTPAIIACGLYHNLMLNSWGDVYAWGRNKNGQIGNTSNTNSATPQRVFSLNANSTYKIGSYTLNNLTGLNSWSETDIKTLYATNLVSPLLWCNFDKNITRAEFAHMMLNVYEKAKGVSVSGNLPTSFKDIEGHALKQDIISANWYGLVNGRSATIFDPDAKVTREEAAKMLCTLLSRMAGVTINTAVLPSVAYYTDANTIGTWAVPYVAYAHDNNIMTGSDGMMNPKGSITREQSLLTIARLAAKYGWHT